MTTTETTKTCKHFTEQDSKCMSSSGGWRFIKYCMLEDFRRGCCLAFEDDLEDEEIKTIEGGPTR